MSKQKTTEVFQQTIEKYLDARASADEQFAKRYPDPKRPVSMCCDYIVEQVRKTGRNGFADEEIYGLAVHFYDEDITDVKRGAMAGVKIVHPGAPELTEEEVAEAKRKALENVERQEAERLAKENAKRKEREAKKEQKRKEQEEQARAAALRADDYPTLF